MTGPRTAVQSARAVNLTSAHLQAKLWLPFLFSRPTTSLCVNHGFCCALRLPERAACEEMALTNGDQAANGLEDFDIDHLLALPSVPETGATAAGGLADSASVPYFCPEHPSDDKYVHSTAAWDAR